MPEFQTYPPEVTKTRSDLNGVWIVYTPDTHDDNLFEPFIIIQKGAHLTAGIKKDTMMDKYEYTDDDWYEADEGRYTRSL